MTEELKLDYNLQTPEERNELVKRIVETSPSEKLTPRYLDILTKYILDAIDKKERKEKLILTDNRLVTLNKRETSYEGLVTKLENGEDGIYNLMSDMGKGAYLTHKIGITPQNIEEVPGLKELVEAIEKTEEAYAQATGAKKYSLKQTLRAMRQDQYVLKESYYKPVRSNNLTKTISQLDLTDYIYFDENNLPQNKGAISFFNPTHISALLCNYSNLKEDCWGKFSNDAYYMMEDLDALIERALPQKHPLYYDLLIMKIDGATNIEIQSAIAEKYGINHSIEYISAIWRQKIPKLLAETAQNEYLIWYYTVVEKGEWKKCSRCGQVKLAHNRFFSKNKTGKGGWYSICKECRNKKAGEK